MKYTTLIELQTTISTSFLTYTVDLFAIVIKKLTNLDTIIKG